MAIVHDQGIVLRTYSFGEADKIIVLISPNSGKKRTVAKGIRKTKSRFGGRLEPFSHVDLVLYQGRNLDTVTQVSVIEAYPELRRSYERVLMAGVMAEAVDAAVQEDEPAAGLFLALQRGLGALESGEVRQDLLAAFFLKLADLLGVAPSLTRCAGCGATAGPNQEFRFGFAAGGLVCATCAPAGAYRLRSGVVEQMAALAAADLRALPTLDRSVIDDVIGVSRRFLEHHLDRRLSSMAVING